MAIFFTHVAGQCGSPYLVQCCLTGYLAQCWGLYLMLGSVVFFGKKTLSQLIAVTTNPSTYLIIGLMTFIIGILHVVAHNLWRYDWQGIVTMLGWAALLKGIMIILFPEWTKRWTSQISIFWYRCMLLLMFLLGFFLFYKGLH